MRRGAALLGLVVAMGAGLPGGELQASPPVYTVSLTPDYREVAGGTRIEFIATVYRYGQVDNAGGHDWDWTTEPAGAGQFEGGTSTLLPRNIWAAPFQPGTYLVKATTRRAQREGQWGVARIVVTAQAQPPPQPACQHYINLAPNRVDVAPGGQFQLQVGCCQHVNANALNWRCGGAAHMGNGVFRAGSQPGTYELLVQDPSGSLRASVTVVIAPPTPTHTCFMRIAPDRQQCQPGGTATFQVTGCTCVHTNSLLWQCQGGYHEGGGRVRMGPQPGSYTLVVTDTHHGFNAQATIEVVQPACCQRIVVAPDGGQCGPGERVQFQATAYDNYNRQMALTLQWGADAGSLQGTWWTAPAQPGRYRIWVRDPQTGVTTQVFVVVQARGAYLLNLEPRTVRCQPGGSIGFTVRAYDQMNNPMQPGTLEWSADAGMCQNGTWWARGCGNGRHVRVTVRDPQTGASDTADIFVP